MIEQKYIGVVSGVNSALVSVLLDPKTSTLKREINGKTYYIGHECMGCQVCRMKCPADAVNYGDDRNEIDQKKCIHCGTCYRECPVSVISEC